MLVQIHSPQLPHLQHPLQHPHTYLVAAAEDVNVRSRPAHKGEREQRVDSVDGGHEQDAHHVLLRVRVTIVLEVAEDELGGQEHGDNNTQSGGEPCDVGHGNAQWEDE